MQSSDAWCAPQSTGAAMVTASAGTWHKQWLKRACACKQLRLQAAAAHASRKWKCSFVPHVRSIDLSLAMAVPPLSTTQVQSKPAASSKQRATSCQHVSPACTPSFTADASPCTPPSSASLAASTSEPVLLSGSLTAAVEAAVEAPALPSPSPAAEATSRTSFTAAGRLRSARSCPVGMPSC